MAVIHISEAEAARDLHGLIARVKLGEHVYLEDGDTTVAVIQPPPSAEKTLTEAIRWAKEQDSKLLLDDQFGDDMESVIALSRNQFFRDPWED